LAILLVYTHPDAADILVNKIAKGRKSVIKYIQKRQEEGYFSNMIDPALFMQVIAMTFAMRVICHGVNDLLTFEHLSRDEVVDQLVNLLLYGIVKREQLPPDTL
ncbi:MAG TPA: hypothetical protein VEI53_02425, partial [Ktedonobacteraceae bacterium]|nr:hypothetical protein [Ktedonobacteraceae bacterium]